MRHKRLKLCTVLLIGFGLAGLQAQTVYVMEKSGTQNAYSLNNIRKMTFSGGNATVQKTDNSTVVYTLSGLRHLSFRNIPTIIVEQAIHPDNANMITYPNPVTDALFIDLTGIACEGKISILNLNGKVLQTLNTSANSIVKINLSQVPQGIYLCRYSSPLEIKTVKIIKH